jgi:hypothetical protein
MNCVPLKLILAFKSTLDDEVLLPDFEPPPPPSELPTARINKAETAMSDAR